MLNTDAMEEDGFLVKAEKERSLFETFPRIYEGRFRRYVPISYGICCGDGWYKIVWDLSEKLEKISANMEICPTVSEIKERNGELYFTMFPKKLVTDEMNESIERAMDLSVATCEVCGESGKYGYLRGIYQTLCSEHRLKFLSKMY